MCVCACVCACVGCVCGSVLACVPRYLMCGGTVALRYGIAVVSACIPMVACLFVRAQRLKYLGHILRSDPNSLTHRVILSRGMDHQPGDLFSDAPLHSSIEELTSIANNRALWSKYVAELQGKGHGNTQKANTATETAEALNSLPPNSIIAYTDGGCNGNGAGANGERQVGELGSAAK